MKRTAIALLIAVSAVVLPASPAAATFNGRNGRIAWAVANAGGGGGGGFASLDTYNSRGGGHRQLANCPEDAMENVCNYWQHATYSPDGTKLLWDQPDSTGRFVIELASADASHPTQVENETADDMQASFSPDASQIVYVRQTIGMGGLFGTLETTDLAGGTVNVVSASVRGAAPEFAPNGRRILFLRPNGGLSWTGAIWSIGLRGGGPRRLIAHAAAFDLAPNGRSIAYLTSGGGLFLARSDGSHARRLAHEPVSDLPSPAVSFSPNGKQIAFSAFGHGHDSGPTIYVVKASGGRPRVLKDALDPRTVTTGLSWQPLP